MNFFALSSLFLISPYKLLAVLKHKSLKRFSQFSIVGVNNLFSGIGIITSQPSAIIFVFLITYS